MNEYFCWLFDRVAINQNITSDNALYAAQTFVEKNVCWYTSASPVRVSVKDDRGHVHVFEIASEGATPTVVHITE